MSIASRTNRLWRGSKARDRANAALGQKLGEYNQRQIDESRERELAKIPRSVRRERERDARLKASQAREVAEGYRRSVQLLQKAADEVASGKDISGMVPQIETVDGVKIFDFA